MEHDSMSHGSAKQGTSTTAGMSNMTVWVMATEAKAPAYNAETSIQDLYAAFGELLISQWLWLSYQLDLNVCGFTHETWNKVYRNNPHAWRLYRSQFWTF
jgi:hypothetical protein